MMYNNILLFISIALGLMYIKTKNANKDLILYVGLFLAVYLIYNRKNTCPAINMEQFEVANNNTGVIDTSNTNYSSDPVLHPEKPYVFDYNVHDNTVTNDPNENLNETQNLGGTDPPYDTTEKNYKPYTSEFENVGKISKKVKNNMEWYKKHTRILNDDLKREEWEKEYTEPLHDDKIPFYSPLVNGFTYSVPTTWHGFLRAKPPVCLNNNEKPVAAVYMSNKTQDLASNIKVLPYDVFDKIYMEGMEKDIIERSKRRNAQAVNKIRGSNFIEAEDFE